MDNKPPSQLENPELLRYLNNQLRPEERRSIRKTEEWETCFRSWLASEQTSEIARTLVMRPVTDPNAEEEFLKSMDGKALRLMEYRMSGTDEVTAMEMLFPYPEDWEDSEDEPPLQFVSEFAEEFFNRVTEAESNDPL
jgi:hypothetical protein